MSSESSENNTKKLHVLVIAHPDDESMFFVPTLRSLQQAGEDVWILCLTTGDYDGLGKEREKELKKAGKVLGLSKVIVENDLKDHPTQRWPISTVADAIERSISKHLFIASNHRQRQWESITLTTFDQFGVSGHVNHIDTHYGVCDLIRRNGGKIQPNKEGRGGEESPIIPLEGWQLKSEHNLFFKYVPFLCWIAFLLSLFHINLPQEDSRFPKYQCLEPWINWNAMKAHTTQFVWYRRLFVIFSIYTYSNELHPIIVTSSDEKSK